MQFDSELPKPVQNQINQDELSHRQSEQSVDVDSAPSKSEFEEPKAQNNKVNGLNEPKSIEKDSEDEPEDPSTANKLGKYTSSDDEF